MVHVFVACEFSVNSNRNSTAALHRSSTRSEVGMLQHGLAGTYSCEDDAGLLASESAV